MLIAIERADGGVSLMNIIGGDAQAEVDKWKALHANEYVKHFEVSPDDLPAERAGRSGWTVQGGKIVVDTAKVTKPRYVDPSAIVSRLAPYASNIKAACDGNAMVWYFWQRMVGRNKPIDTSDPEFPQAWTLLENVIGKDNATRILSEVMAEATP